jgi:hypothetical protein
MATYNKFHAFVEHVAEKVHDLGADTIKVFLTNTAPVSSNSVKADIATEATSGVGYTTGGNTAAQSASSQTLGVYKLVLNSPTTWAAAGGTIGPFRYAVVYNDTPTSPADPLMYWLDYGSAITLLDGEKFFVSLSPTNGVLTIT